jgi:ABC-2 type transport system ATP-binding protein
MSYGARDLSVSYGKLVALDGVDLNVEGGEIVAVAGGDGAGKSTLMRALTGVQHIDHGTVHAPAPNEIGYMPSGSGVYADLTCAENLAFTGSAYGVRGKALSARSDELLDRIGLTGARDRLGGALSGGMRQKLALAMALLHRPALLVLDEPTTGVDPVSRRELWSLIGDSARGGAAVVLATTYLDEADRAGHVTVLDEGRVLIAGLPAQLVATVQGRVFTTEHEPATVLRWRRGKNWHYLDGAASGGEPIGADLQDAVVAAALKAREEAA